MEAQQHDLDLALLKAATSGAPPEEIQRIGREVKRELWQRWLGLMTQAGMVDFVVGRFAPDPQWIWGVQDPDARPQPVPPTLAPPSAVKTGTQSARKDKILAVARQILSDGARTVRSVAIADRLKREGEAGDLRNLVIGVGNTLSRNGWNRVGGGEYELAGANLDGD